jgi:hypothetical protein
MKVTNLETEHCHLVTAIDLFSTGADPVSAHSLACNAREIYEKNLPIAGPVRHLDTETHPDLVF